MYKVADYCNQFNIIKFLEDHRKFKRKRDELQRKLENIPLLPSKGEDPTGVRGSGGTSLLETVALRRLPIEEQIAQLDDLLNIYDYAFDRLTKQEQDVITLFYSEERSDPIRRDAFCRKYFTNESDLYSKYKPRAVEHFREIIEDTHWF